MLFLISFGLTTYKYNYSCVFLDLPVFVAGRLLAVSFIVGYYCYYYYYYLFTVQLSAKNTSEITLTCGSCGQCQAGTF